MNPITSNEERTSERVESDGGTVSPSRQTRPIQQAPDTVRPPRETTVCVVGLGYVGLPLAVHFAQARYPVIGYDIDREKVETLQRGVDTTGDLSDELIRDGEISYTTQKGEIAEAEYVIVTVPTPVDENEQPNLEYVEAAGRTVGGQLTVGTTVILESTVYPGATQEVFLPALEAASGLSAPDDFGVAYSPERVTPGDSEHDIPKVVKVVGGQTGEVLENVATLYESVVDAGVHRAPSIEVAEASKVVENVQRDLNIAFVNELSMAFERMNVDLDTHDVLEAAKTKWNFHDYRPGLVGGHCIPVDPHFFSQCSKRAGFVPELMLRGREVNETVPEHVADMTIKALSRNGKALGDARVLILGLSYKADVADIRTSKAGDVAKHLREYALEVEGYDPIASPTAMRDAFDLDIRESLSFSGVDAVILATPHEMFQGLDLEEMARGLNPDPVLVDVTNAIEPETVRAAGITYRRL